MYSSRFHLADMQVCQAENLHVCHQYDCAVYTSANKLEQQQDHLAKHHDSRTISNLVLCLKSIQGKLPPNYNPILDKGPQFINNNTEPDPANFQLGVCEKVEKGSLEQLDEGFMGIIYFSS